MTTPPTKTTAKNFDHDTDPDSPQFKHIIAKCHCGSNTFKVKFDKKRGLPIGGGLCHCDSCRHSSGTMGCNHVRIDGDPERIGVEGQSENQDRDQGELLRAYATTPIATRYFCAKCGAHMFWKYDTRWMLDDSRSEDERGRVGREFGVVLDGSDKPGYRPGTYWCVAVGVLDKGEQKEIVRHECHIWVGDSLESGYIEYLGLGGLKKYAGEYEQSDVVEAVPKASRGRDFYCHCRKVEFRLPERDYKVRHCDCEKCRRTTGFEAGSWLLVPLEQLGLAGLEQYEKMYFCGRCGASVYVMVNSEWAEVGLGLGSK